MNSGEVPRRKTRGGPKVGRGEASAVWTASSPLSAVASISRGIGYGTILSCIFFVLFYLDIRQFVDPRLLYHANRIGLPTGQAISFPIFFRGIAFFKEFLGRPGGLTEYVAAANCQYYYYSYVGPLILTAIAWLVFLVSDRLIRNIGGTGSRSLRYIPPLLLLITYNQYTFHLEDCIALFVALALTNFYVSVADRVGNAAVRFLLFSVASAALYYAVGGPYVLFAILCALVELLTNQRYVLGILYILAAVGIPLTGKCLFDIPLADAYSRLTGVYPFQGVVKTAPLSALYVFFVIMVIALPFRRRIEGLASAVTSRISGFDKYYRNSRLKALCLVLVLVIVSPLAALATLDRDARRILRANYFARTEMWPEFLQEIRRYPSSKYTGSTIMDINRALFETGQLGEKMFSCPQAPALLFEVGKEAVLYKGCCEVLLRLGRVNEAEHSALEALEVIGDRPQTLRHLAIINIVKGRSETARVFSAASSRDLVHGSWAEDCLRRLDDDPLLKSDKLVKYVRSVMPTEDTIDRSKDKMLLALLAGNRGNRMAFEYLMAYYLLTKELEKIVSHIGRLDDFDYPTIPERYAEAIVLYARSTGRRPNLHGRTIGAHTLKRFREFYETVKNCLNDEEAVRNTLAAKFPDSYFRYFKTSQSGGTE